MHSPQGILPQSWYQRVSPTQDRNKEQREGVHSTVIEGGGKGNGWKENNSPQCTVITPKKPRQQSSANRPTPSRTHVTEVADEENAKPQSDVRDLWMQLQAMTTEDRGELLNSLMRNDLDF